MLVFESAVLGCGRAAAVPELVLALPLLTADSTDDNPLIAHKVGRVERTSETDQARPSSRLSAGSLPAYDLFEMFFSPAPGSPAGPL